MTRRAFTLVELVVALVIGALVAGATTGLFWQFSKAKARAVARQEAFARADAAADRIASDIAQAARESEMTYARVAITDGGEGSDGLLLWTRSLALVRGSGDAPEGADREVQYRIEPTQGTPALWRRVDAPADLYLDAGGVAEPIVRGVASLDLAATDGSNWFNVWDSDQDGYPHAVRVVVSASSQDGSSKSVARRVVALDRTPVPEVTEE